ncbi:MAG: transcription termination/antitermination NusG family protein, partial [Spirochaetes bacterium]|nr:transcription termination/antitermination NusG family protein [Spirochaetota bacterium]
MEYPLTNWYVVQTISKQENNVKKKVDKIKLEGLITLLPMRRLCIKRKGRF